MPDLVKTDYIVVGSGIAGLRAAIDLAGAGSVTVFTKAEITESNSAYAQGGIAAAIGPNDSTDRHYADTMAAGAGLCEPDAVRVLVEEGPAEIERLIRWGADFEKQGETLSLGREGGHSSPRIVHGHGCLTGEVVVQTLLKTVRLPNVRIVPFTLFRDLLLDGERVIGVQFEHSGRIVNCVARSTLVATGGGAQVFRENTNPGTATGDGFAAAFRAGALLRDMEFVQFHPTVLNLPGAPRFLLTEALRGEGARILDQLGNRFVDELSTRDEVSRAVYRRMAETNANVFLDVTHVPASVLQAKFRHIYMTCLQYGLDITADRIPITPAAHYFMGGIVTDLDGRTNLAGLYAAGEVASTGVHGANRLASNSLLEALVFGGRAAGVMSQDAMTVKNDAAPKAEPLIPAPSHISSEAMRGQIRDAAWRWAGLVRNADGLKKGLEFLNKAAPAHDDVMTQNMVAVARIILESALARQESRGAHYREDFPLMSARKVHSYIHKGAAVQLRSRIA
jgi:L-aspartate oxidase